MDLHGLSVQGRVCYFCVSYSTCIGTTGFSGLKGCIGAEFISRGIPPSALTEEECENMQFGMTDCEAAAFMSRGSSLWCDCSPPSSSTFCMDDIPVSITQSSNMTTTLYSGAKLITGFQ